MTPSTMSILVLNGPNLGNIGVRQPEIYGTRTLAALPEMLRTLMPNDHKKIELHYFHTNSEGGLLDRLELARAEGMAGVVLNAGAYTHSSLALADCLAWIGLPVVEVHISNIFGRSESIRHQSLLARHTIGVIAGFGILGYALGAQALYMHIHEKTASAQ